MHSPIFVKVKSKANLNRILRKRVQISPKTENFILKQKKRLPKTATLSLSKKCLLARYCIELIAQSPHRLVLCRIAGHLPQIGEYTSGQEVGADKVRRTVMGTFLVAAADITVLLALVRLVSLLIHHAAAVRTERYAGEQAHFIIAVGAFTLLAKFLHPFPCLCVYDRLVVVLENHLLFRGIFYVVLDFVRELFCLEVYQTARVFPVFKDMHNGIGRPLALIAGVVAAGASRLVVFQRPRP